MRPAAIGRNCLRGCSRSRSTSRASFNRYPPDAMALNSHNATKAVRSSGTHVSGWSQSHAVRAEKMNAANSSRFFCHCIGRHATMKSRTNPAGLTTGVEAVRADMLGLRRIRMALRVH